MALSDEINNLYDKLGAMQVIFDSVAAALANEIDGVYRPSPGSEAMNILLDSQISINQQISQAYKDLDKMYQAMQDLRDQVTASTDKARERK